MATYSNRTHQKNARLVKVAEMLLMGSTQTQIAIHFKLSNATIHNDVKLVKERWREEAISKIDDFVNVESARLDLIINAIMPKARAGKLLVIDRLCRLIELKMKLYGIDAKHLSENLREIMQGGKDISAQTVAEISAGLRELETLVKLGEGGGNGISDQGDLPTIN